MKVRPVDLTEVLGYRAAAISVAVKRGKLNKTLDGLIDLTDTKNHAWICKALARQGREIPDEISALFKATPLTETDNNQDDNRIPEGGQSVLNSETGKPASPPKELSETARRQETYKADKMKADAELAKVRLQELRGQLIKINPFGKFLVGMIAAERNQVLNSIPNIAKYILDEIKSALLEGKTDSEILLKLSASWTDEVENIYKTLDRDIKTRIAFIRSKTTKETKAEFDAELSG